MLIKTKFRIPDVFLGMMLAIAIFALGGAFLSSYAPPNNRSPNENTQQSAKSNTDQNGSDNRIAEYTRGLYIATVVLAGSTILLMCATLGLGIINGRELKLARAEFIASHRPKLRIRRIFLREPLAINQPIRIRILAANIGQNEATLDSMGLAIYFGDIAPDAEPRPQHPAQTIPAGEQAIIDGEGPIFSVVENAQLAQGAGLHVLGVINYRDDNRVIRTTAFARRWAAGVRRFVPVPDDHPESDREYEN